MAKPKKLDALWHLAESWRSRGLPRDAAEIIEFSREARLQGIDVTFRQLLEFVGRDNRAALAEGLAPALFSDFAIAYLAGEQLRRLLDPWAGAGVTASEVADALLADEALALTPNFNWFETARALGSQRVEWRLGNPIQLLPDLDVGRFDAVVSAPPFNMQRSRRAFDANGAPVEAVDSEERLLILDASSRLASDGEGLFLVPDSFFFGSGRTVWSVMPELSLYPQAVIGLPPRVLAPKTSVDASILIVGHTERADLFIGQANAGNLTALVANVRARREGPTPELGRLVDRAAFIGVAAEFDAERVEAWARRSGLRAMKLGEVSERIAFYSRRNDGFDDAANAVYVSGLGTPRVAAATNAASLRTKPENCFQLVLKTDLALAEYVAAFFNSERGRQLRQSWSVGAALRRIPKGSLDQRTIYLPDLERQAEIVRLDDSARMLRSRLREVEIGLWETPERVDELRAELAAFVEDEGAWIEELPFPLASILWRYRAELEARDKAAHLLHFFEGLSAFTASVLLSGFRSDDEVFAEYRERWLGRVRSLNQATFGTWVTLNKLLAAAVRELLATNDGERVCLDLFRTTRPTLPAALASEELEGILEAARQRRNDWAGHGGAADEREYHRRLDVLETDLAGFREVVGGAFRSCKLLRPGAGRSRGGVHLYSAQSLMGSRREFRTIQVETTTVMDEDRIYMLDFESRQPLEIIPFFQIRPGPETEEDACYFYSRVEDANHVRLISYHFGREPEIARARAPELIEIVNSLTRRET